MKNRAGVTLVELLLSLALISFIIVGITNLFLIGTKTHAKTLDEFNVQSTVRLISQSVNGIIRDSSGIFLLDKEFPDESTNLETYLTEGWNYLMLNEDKSKLIEWVWNDVAKEHKERTVIDTFQNVTYDLAYNKESAANIDRLLGYTLDVNVNGQKRTITSELEGVNTLQIIDRSYGGIANTIAYRSDSRLSDIAVAQAAVSFVVDKSQSMERSLDGSTRMSILKEEAEFMIEELAKNDNINLSISPFSTDANDRSEESNLHEMMPLKANKDKFIGDNSIIDKLEPDHTRIYTNTGDGMRRGYFSIYNYNDKNKDKTVKNFMIILVDGETNTSSIVEKVNKTHTESGFLISRKSSVTINGRVYNYNSTSGFIIVTHKYIWQGENQINFLDKDGNVNPPNNSSFSENTLYPDGKTNQSDGNEYVKKIGDLIERYRNTRDDGIEVFIIGFSPDASPTGLQLIADSTKSIHGNYGGSYKYYKADTSEALETVLNEIKFQITDKLWHIGGPN